MKTRDATGREAGDVEAWRCPMGDVVYLGIALGFFVLSWGFIVLCDRL